MAKEMKQNFGARSKNAPKAGSGVGSACGQNSSSWGVSAIPPINNGSQDMMINPGNFSDVTNHGNNGPLHEGNMDHYNDYSNNSSTQSNSNSEFSDINEPSVPGPGASSASAQVFRQQKIQQPRYKSTDKNIPKDQIHNIIIFLHVLTAAQPQRNPIRMVLKISSLKILMGLCLAIFITVVANRSSRKCLHTLF